MTQTTERDATNGRETDQAARESQARATKLERLNAALADVAAARKRFNDAKAMLGTATAEYDKRKKAYRDAREALERSLPDVD